MASSHETDPSGIVPSANGIPANERAQDHLDSAVFMARAFKRKVQLTVGENGEASYEFGEPNSSSPTREVPIVDFSNSRPASDIHHEGRKPPKSGAKNEPRLLKTHDLSHFTGFYRGVYYDDGTPRPSKKPKVRK